MEVGKSVRRVDAFDKATGRAKYCDDLCDRSALVARVLHSTIANGVVKSIDTSAAEQIEGVVKIVTCFDVPQIKFPTAGHPWSTDPHHQDVADRLLLTSRVRFYGDDIAAVVAENEVAAAQALRALRVEYEEYPFVLDVQEAMKPDAPLLHEEFPNNILAHTTIRNGNYEEASREPGLIKVEGWYDTPTVQHCHIENHMCFASMEAGRIVIYSSTQIPHIVRRVVGQALGIPWGKVRVVKPYIGGGFGNKQDALYEPLCAYLSTVVGGLLALGVLLLRDGPLCIRKPGSWRITSACLRNLWRVGTPLAAERAALSSAQVLLVRIVSGLGTVAIAANSLGVSAEGLCYMAGYGIQDASIALIGQAVGAHRRDMAKRFAWLCTAMGIAIMALSGVGLWLFAPALMGIFTADAAVIALGARVLRIEAFAEPMFGASIVASGAMQGAGDSTACFLLNLLSMWGIRLTLAFLLAPRLGLVGVWAAMCLELCIRGVLFLLRLARGKWLDKGALQ